MRMYQMKGHFKGFSKLVIHYSCRFQRPRKMLSTVQRHLRKVTQETHKNQEISDQIISLASFEPISAALLLLETAVIALIWEMI